MQAMVYSIGQPWLQVDIHLPQWGRIFCPSQVCDALYISIAATHIQCAATLTDVECAFSCGGLTVSKMRHSLSNESTCMASVLGAWCDLPGAILQEEVIEVFKEKSKQPKGNNVLSHMADVVMF